jgi:hypothetical protein
MEVYVILKCRWQKGKGSRVGMPEKFMWRALNYLGGGNNMCPLIHEDVRY